MAEASLPSYIDPFSGLSLPINHLPGELPEQGEGAVGMLPLKSDLHHGLFDEAAFTALDSRDRERRGWMWRVPRWAHVWYHEQAGPIEPDDDPARHLWRMALIALEYVPLEGVIVPRKGEITRVPLSFDRRVMLRMRSLHTENRGRVKSELLRCVVDHGLAVGPGTIEDFVYEKDIVIRAVEGKDILRIACAEATKPLRDRFAKAHARQRFPIRYTSDVGQSVLNFLSEDSRGGINLDVISWLGQILEKDVLRVA